MRIFIATPDGACSEVANPDTEDAPAWVGEVVDWGIQVGDDLFIRNHAVVLRLLDDGEWVIEITPDGSV